MSRGPASDEWDRIDGAAQPGEYVDFLDFVTGIEVIQAYKRRSYDFLRLRPAQHVLDVGCGTGDDVRAMAAKVGPSGRAVGIDNSEVMIAEAKKRSAGLGLSVEFRTGVASDLPFEDDSFHATRADRVFQHLVDPETALREMVRVTRSGGRVGVLDPDWETAVVDSSDQRVTRQVLTISLSTKANPWAGRQHYSLFQKAGLREVSVLPVAIPMLGFSIAENVLGLRDSVKRAVEKAGITEDEGSEWLGDLEKRDRDGRFFSSLTGFGVFATKP